MKTNVWSETILQGIPEIVYVFNTDGYLVRWNKNAETVLGYSVDEFKRMHVTEFIVPIYREKVLEVFHRIMTTHKNDTVEHKFLTKDGRKLPYIGSGSYAQLNGKDYLIGQAINISKLKTTEKALKHQIKKTKRLKNELSAENILLKNKIKNRQGLSGIIGESASMNQLCQKIKQIAELDNLILIEGETGTGKNLFASTIHSLSSRKLNPFIKINCASTTSAILNTELFGAMGNTEFNSFTEQPGKLELANGGTLLLDNIEQMPFDIQFKLLQFIDDEGTIKYPQRNKVLKIDVRLIVTASDSLKTKVENNQFSKALYFRLNSYLLKTPTLRERMIDIPLLAEHFIVQFNEKHNKNIKKIPIKSMALFNDYNWPGNIREFKNTIEHSVLISKNTILKVVPFDKLILNNEEGLVPFEQFERDYLIKVLKKTNWRISGPKGASNILKIHPETLRSKLKKLDISKP
jgi:PAS domain S-box-containing protein|tara:strand:- start:1298 stop:2686 length:1389 start_codon:yes stop_codon:yes gene_type:complete